MSRELTIQDHLRGEYFTLLPKMRRTLLAVETKVRHLILPVAISAHDYERVIVTSRLKECESAVAALKRRQEGGTFEPGRFDLYSLSKLPDLVGVRVMAFPPMRLGEVHSALQPLVCHWVADPVTSSSGETLAFKYFGRSVEASTDVNAEVQITSALIGLFWEVEHSALYKPTPDLKNAVQKGPMKKCADEVLAALRAFEQEFDRVIGEREDLRSAAHREHARSDSGSR